MEYDQQSTLTTIISMSQLEESQLPSTIRQLLIESLVAASKETRVDSFSDIRLMCINSITSMTGQQWAEAVRQYERMGVPGVYSRNGSTLEGCLDHLLERIRTLSPREACTKLIAWLQLQEQQQTGGLQVLKDVFMVSDRLAFEQSRKEIIKAAEEEAEEIKKAALSEAKEIKQLAQRAIEAQGLKKVEEIAQLAENIRLLRLQRLHNKEKMEEDDSALDKLFEESLNLSIQLNKLMVGEKQKRMQPLMML